MGARSILLGTCLLVTSLVAAPAGVAQGVAAGGTASGVRKIEAPRIEAPIRVVPTPEGGLLVSDYRARRIFVLDPATRRVVNSFSVDGSPLGVACAAGFVLVGNDSRKRVDILDRAGKPRGVLGGGGTTFAQPNDIALDTAARLAFVVDSGENLVKIFRTGLSGEGRLLRTIPPSGPDPDLLAHPTGIAVDPSSGEIVVSDFGATEISIKPRLQVFDYDGNLLATISGKEGMLGYRFYRPQGLALDGTGRIFLADSFLGLVLILDRQTGATIDRVGTYGTDPGNLALPLDVAIAGEANDLFVTNNWHGRLEVFPQPDGGEAAR